MGGSTRQSTPQIPNAKPYKEDSCMSGSSLRDRSTVQLRWPYKPGDLSACEGVGRLCNTPRHVKGICRKGLTDLHYHGQLRSTSARVATAVAAAGARAPSCFPNRPDRRDDSFRVCSTARRGGHKTMMHNLLVLGVCVCVCVCACLRCFNPHVHMTRRL